MQAIETIQEETPQGSLINKLTFWDAVISWRNIVICNRNLTSQTKDEYLSGVYRVIKAYPQLIETNLISFINKEYEEIYKLLLINEKWGEKTRKQTLEYLKSVYRHAITNLRYIQSVPKPINHKNELSLARAKRALSSPRVLEELKTLTAEKMVSLFSNLPKVNQRDFFVIKLIWMAQYPLPLLLRLKFKNFIEKELNAAELDGEPLDMEAEVLFETAPYLYERVKEELKRLDIQSKYNLEQILILDPISLKKLVVNLLEETPELKEITFFQTNKGKELVSGQIISTLKKACKPAKIKPAVTPKTLYAHAIFSTMKDRLFIMEQMHWTHFYRELEKIK